MSPWLDLRLCARCLLRAAGRSGKAPEPRESVDAGPPPGPDAMRALRLDPESALLGAVRAGIVLVLMTPLVTAPWTLYPYRRRQGRSGRAFSSP